MQYWQTMEFGCQLKRSLTQLQQYYLFSIAPYSIKFKSWLFGLWYTCCCYKISRLVLLSFQLWFIYYILHKNCNGTRKIWGVNVTLVNNNLCMYAWSNTAFLHVCVISSRVKTISYHYPEWSITKWRKNYDKSVMGARKT